MGGELNNLAIIKQDGQLLVGSRDKLRRSEGNEWILWRVRQAN